MVSSPLTPEVLPGWLATIGEALRGHETLVFAGAGVVALVVWAAVSCGASPRDPQRLFTPEQRMAAFRRAQGRCEMETFWFTRCRRPAGHADHWWPWARGGLTSDTNLVAACGKCNLRKSARRPSRMATARLVRRRRRYFPAGYNRAAGQRYRSK